VHGADAGVLEFGLEPEVEVRGIDADEYVRPPCEHAFADIRAQAQQARQVVQHLDEAHDREFAAVVPAIQAGRAHGGAADAGEFGVGMALPQFLDQAGAEQVARGFAGDQRDAHRVSATRRAGWLR